MNILIDTHIFLWLTGDTSKVSQKHFEYIKDTKTVSTPIKPNNILKFLI